MLGAILAWEGRFPPAEMSCSTSEPNAKSSYLVAGNTLDGRGAHGDNLVLVVDPPRTPWQSQYRSAAPVLRVSSELSYFSIYEIRSRVETRLEAGSSGFLTVSEDTAPANIHAESAGTPLMLVRS